MSRRAVLLGCVFVVAACGLVYELVAGAVSAYLLGNAITQYSLVIGVFLCAMGLGSWLARFIRGDLLRRFVQIELVLALVGGLSSLSTYAFGAWLSAWFGPLFYGQLVFIGALVGLEIPLLVRLLKEDQRIEEALSDALALDYVGALLGALAFPFLALPFLGMTRASLAFGLLNLAVAAWASTLLQVRLWGPIAGVAVALIGAWVGSGTLVGHLEDRLYQDRVVYAEQSAYQRIVLTRWRDDVRLYLDGHIQFSTVDEARYHEALAVPALAATVPREVLILGGGDGLLAHRVLRDERVQSVDIVDLDPAVTQLARSHAALVEANGAALDDPRVRVHNADAMEFLENTEQAWDVVLLDLPDPHSAALAKLYSTSFYATLARRLRAQGVLATQATSPFYAPAAYWCVVDTLEASGFQTRPYHASIPSFGEWGFILAGRDRLPVEELEPSFETQVLDAEALRALFVWDKELGARPEPNVNTLDDPVLATLYERGWRTFNQ